MFLSIIQKYCDVRMSLLLPIFWCYFFLIYLFVTAKEAAMPKIVLKKLPGLGGETSNQYINSSVVRSGYNKHLCIVT